LTVNITVSIGHNAGTDGTIIVDGTNSELHVKLLNVGSSGTGMLKVINGGKVTTATGAGVFIGGSLGSHGTVLVGSGSVLDCQFYSLSVGSTAGGTGLLMGTETVSGIINFIGGTIMLTAIASLMNNEAALRLYCTDGTLQIGNNACEVKRSIVRCCPIVGNRDPREMAKPALA